MYRLRVVSVFFFSSRRRHTRCALVTGVQTCALPISLHRNGEIAPRELDAAAQAVAAIREVQRQAAPNAVREGPAVISRVLDRRKVVGAIRVVGSRDGGAGGVGKLDRRAGIDGGDRRDQRRAARTRSEEHTSELQSLMRNS